jgi:hypothetical protein
MNHQRAKETLQAIAIGEIPGDPNEPHSMLMVARKMALAALQDEEALIPTVADIDDAVELWHGTTEDDMGLPAFLGWSFDEYAEWCLDENRIPQRPLPLVCASRIEARRAATLGAVHESLIGAAETPNPLPHSHAEAKQLALSPDEPLSKGAGLAQQAAPLK